MPPDEVTLLKLVWHPEDLDGNQVKPTAFSSRDLSGQPGDHVSVDRGDMATKASMEAVAAKQYANINNGVTVFREIAHIGRLPCGQVRAIDFQGAAALAVDAIPIDGNDAHCGISNRTKQKSRSYLAEVRGKLARLASPPILLDAAYENPSSIESISVEGAPRQAS